MRKTILSKILTLLPHFQTWQTRCSETNRAFFINLPPQSNHDVSSLSTLSAMSRPSIALPLSPMAVQTAQKPLLTRQALYSPPAIRQWVQSQDPQPYKVTIDAERHKRRQDVHKDQKSHPTSFNFLHPHFCLNSEDRNLAFHEAVNDMRDAVRMILPTPRLHY